MIEVKGITAAELDKGLTEKSFGYLSKSRNDVDKSDLDYDWRPSQKGEYFKGKKAAFGLK